MKAATDQNCLMADTDIESKEKCIGIYGQVLVLFMRKSNKGPNLYLIFLS